MANTGVKFPQPPAGPPLRQPRPNFHRRETVLTSKHVSLPDEGPDSIEYSAFGSDSDESDGEGSVAERRPCVLPRKSVKHFGSISITNSLLRNNGLCVKGMVSGWPIFKGCSGRAVEVLAEQAATQRYCPGQLVLQAGCDCRSLIFVVRGSLDVVVDDMKVGSLTAGAFMGETLVLGVEDEWRVTLRAPEDTRGHQESPRGSGRAPPPEDCIVGELRQEVFQSIASHRQDAASHRQEMARWLDALKGLPKASDADAVLSKARLFRGFSETGLQQLRDFSAIRLFFPGEAITKEGVSCGELLVLVRGLADVEMAGRHVHVLDAEQAEEPICLGEFGFLGFEPLKTTTVTALSVCTVRVVYAGIFQRALQDYGDQGKAPVVADFLQARRRGPHKSSNAVDWFHHAAIFKDTHCSRPFLEFLAGHLEERVYHPDQLLVDDTTDDRCVYMLGHGAVRVFEHGRVLGTLRGGSTLGEINLLGATPHNGRTVVAEEISCTAVLHPSVVLKGLEMFPQERTRLFDTGPRSFGINHANRVLSASVEGEHRRTLLNSVLKAPLFEGMALEFVEQLSNLAVDRFFMPGELIVQEGRQGTSMFVIVSGEALVFTDRVQVRNYKAAADAPGEQQLQQEKEAVLRLEVKQFDRQASHKVRHLGVGSAFGELAMLGISEMRSATVQAETFCCLWEICQSKVVQFMADFPTFKRNFVSIIVSHLETTVSARLQGLAPFKDFDQPFRTLLSLSCKRRVYFPGQVIATREERGQGMLVLNVGEAEYEHTEGMATVPFNVGSYIGCDIMLGTTKQYKGTLTALTVCHILLISRDHYKNALQKYPAPASAEALLESSRGEAMALQAEVKRMKLQTFVMNRCLTAAHGPATLHRIKYQGMLQGMIGKVFLGWAAYTKEITEHRRQQRFRQSKEQEWISRHVLVRRQKLLEERLANLQSQRFDWVAVAAWDDSTHVAAKGSKKARLPRVAPIVGPSLRTLDLPTEAPEVPAFLATPRMALPPI